MVLFWTHHLRQAIYGMAVDAVEKEARNRGYVVLIGESDASRADEMSQASEMWPVDGVLAYDRPIHVRTYLASRGVKAPIVSVGPQVNKDCDYVKVDLYSGCFDAMRHLVEQGCKRIVMLDTEVPGETGQERKNAYLDVMRESGLEPEFISNLPVDRDALREPLEAFIQSKGVPDALYCWHDSRAIAANCVMHDLGIRVPEDVAIIGLDDIDEVRYQRPALSTVAFPMEELFRTAWNFLENRIENPDGPKQTAEYRSSLVIRESTLRRK
jgi:LacI family transcriptional regulator